MQTVYPPLGRIGAARISLPDSFFTVPAGLKKIKAVTEVVSGARTREQDPALSEFLDSGSSHHFGKEEKKK